MSPKEKAKEIFNQFKNLAQCDWHPQTGFDLQQATENQIACALICVDEIIKATQRETINQSGTGVEIIPKKYWLEVKQEISDM